MIDQQKDEWLAARRAATWRRRRVIQNNDGDDVIRAKEPTPEAFWAERCCGLEGTQVDTIAYNTSCSFGLCTHDSRVAELFVSSTIDWRSRAREFIERGRDCLQLILDFGRKHDIEVFWTARMSDTHDNWHPYQVPKFKRDHPELLLFQPEDIGRPPAGRVEPHMHATAVDYGRQEVRDRQFEIMRDVCERYDIDGIEMDFLRQPMYFRPTLEGRAVEDEHVRIMAEFVTRVRAMTEEVGTKRGRPLLVSCIVPADLELGKRVGLDLESWLANDLLDLVVAWAEFAPWTEPFEDIVALAHKHDRPVYACMSEGADIAGWAGKALNAWNAGVDGIYTYNQFVPSSPMWRLIGDPASLLGVDKRYEVENIAARRTWLHVIRPEGRLPLSVKPNEPAVADIVVGEAVPPGFEAILVLRFGSFTFSDRLRFTLNGIELQTEIDEAAEGRSPVAVGTFRIISKPDASLIHKGRNKFEVDLIERCPSAAGFPVLTGLELRVTRV